MPSEYQQDYKKTRAYALKFYNDPNMSDALRDIYRTLESKYFHEGRTIDPSFYNDFSDDSVAKFTVIARIHSSIPWCPKQGEHLQLVVYFILFILNHVKMDDLNITMKEYIRLDEEKARRHGKVYHWEAATYGKIWYDEDVHNLRSVETEFPAIVLNDTLTSEVALSCEPMTLELGLVYLSETTIMSTMDLDGVTYLNWNEDTAYQRLDFIGKRAFSLPNTVYPAYLHMPKAKTGTMAKPASESNYDSDNVTHELDKKTTIEIRDEFVKILQDNAFNGIDGGD
ncbi:hypothetical protein Tco_1561746, partial [Tanacetum coccineum]